MNRLKSFLFLVLAMVQTGPGLIAQRQVYAAKVPFQFSVGDRTLPAGEYFVIRRNAFLHLDNGQTYTTAVILSSGTDSSRDSEVHLVFDQVNHTFFLRKVIDSAGSVELAVSRAEREARKEQHRLSSADPPATTRSITAVGGR